MLGFGTFVTIGMVSAGNTKDMYSGSKPFSTVYANWKQRSHDERSQRCWPIFQNICGTDWNGCSAGTNARTLTHSLNHSFGLVLLCNKTGRDADERVCLVGLPRWLPQFYGAGHGPPGQRLLPFHARSDQNHFVQEDRGDCLSLIAHATNLFDEMISIPGSVTCTLSLLTLQQTIIALENGTVQYVFPKNENFHGYVSLP